ncbi:hypothetical protein AX16_002243 [Volvariella volvacea WC 439]|nr:hypothetical protein AX16_002243 [Volvariella volvacea WC 439]
MIGIGSKIGFLSAVFCLLTSCELHPVSSTPIIYDGRARFNLTAADLDASNDPFLTVVKGTEAASHYTELLGRSVRPTSLWSHPFYPTEQAISVSIDNSSVFYPGGNNPQFGFRRTELIAQKNKNPGELNEETERGTTVFHFSIRDDYKLGWERRLLDMRHEYQIVFIEPSDGTHVFGVQLGTPFANPTSALPAANANHFKILDHSLNVIFSTPFIPGGVWHNFAIQVDWKKSTLGVWFSRDGKPLQPVTKLVENKSVPPGEVVKGEFHFGLLKLPLVNPADSPQNQNDVVHYGLQEGTREALLYSGVFIEDVKGGISVAPGQYAKPIGS